MDKRTRKKVKSKHAATRPNAKRSSTCLPTVKLRRTSNAVANAVTAENSSNAFYLTSETKPIRKLKQKAKQGRLMVRIEQPVRLTLKSFPKWDSFSVTFDEFIEYWKQGTSFANCICSLYREAL